MAQAPYPPLDISEADDFVVTGRANAEDILQALSLQDFIASKQQVTLGVLPEAVYHPTATPLQSCPEEGISFGTGPPWSRAYLGKTAKNGPHASACAPDMVHFIWWEMHWRVQDGFSILLTAEDAVQVFGEKLKLSRIEAVPLAHCRPRLILSFLSQLDKETPSVNNTTDS